MLEKSKHRHRQQPQKVGLLLVPGFSMVGFSAIVEPMRVANRLAGSPLYDCSIVTIDGQAPNSSSGIPIPSDRSIAQSSAKHDLIIVCSGFFDRKTAKSQHLLDWLRKQAALGCTMGAISTGAEFLANAGLLDGYRCTIHWENEESFRENHASAILTGGLYEINPKRITAAGGIAALDMMLNWIALSNDEYMVTAIAEQFIHSPSRIPGEMQRKAEIKLVQRRSPKLAKAIELMMANVESPLSSVQICRRVGLSRRQLERLFSEHRHKTLHRYYLELRLNQARYLIFQTGMPLLQISIASGFSSQSHFSRRYKDYFQSTPSQDRHGETLDRRVSL